MPSITDNSASYDSFKESAVSNIGVFSTRSWIRKFGFNPDVGTTEEVIWSAGGTYNFLTAADNLRIASGGNAADDAAGAGARSVTIVGLDENWDTLEETIATNGASVSTATTGAFIRVYRAYVADCGTYDATGTGTGANTSDIVIETSGGTTVAQIDAEKGQSQMSLFSVRRGYTAYITEIDSSAEVGKPVTTRMYTRENANVTSAPVTSRRLRYENVTEAGYSLRLDAPIRCPEYTDIWFTGFRGTGTSTVDVNYDILMVKNNT